MASIGKCRRERSPPNFDIENQSADIFSRLFGNDGRYTHITYNSCIFIIIILFYFLNMFLLFTCDEVGIVNGSGNVSSGVHDPICRYKMGRLTANATTGIS